MRFVDLNALQKKSYDGENLVVKDLKPVRCRKASFWTMLGPWGPGKTPLPYLMARGFRKRARTADIRLDGKNRFNNISAAQTRHWAMVFQEHAAFPAYDSCRKNLAFSA